MIAMAIFSASALADTDWHSVFINLPKSANPHAVSTCPFNDPPGCSDAFGLSKKSWLTVTGITGEKFDFSLSSVEDSGNGYKTVVTYTEDPGGRFDPNRIHRYLFDCRGHFQSLGNGVGMPEDAPPNSVPGKISAVICSQKK